MLPEPLIGFTAQSIFDVLGAPIAAPPAPVDQPGTKIYRPFSDLDMAPLEAVAPPATIPAEPDDGNVTV